MQQAVLVTQSSKYKLSRSGNVRISIILVAHVMCPLQHYVTVQGPDRTLASQNEPINWELHQESWTTWKEARISSVGTLFHDY